MSNLYVAEATVTLRLGSRSTALLDRDNDGTADTGLLAALIESAGRTVNMQLRQRYGSSVPFAEITATPVTPEEIQELALRLVLWDIYSWANEAGAAKANRDLADAALAKLLGGDYDISGVARAKSYEGKHIVVATHEDPVFAGVDSAGVERVRGI